MLTYRRTLPRTRLTPCPFGARVPFPSYESDARKYKRHRDSARNKATNDNRSVRGGRLFSGYQARKCVTSVTVAGLVHYTYHAVEETSDSI